MIVNNLINKIINMTKNNKVRLIIKVMIIEKILKNIKNRKINWNN